MSDNVYIDSSVLDKLIRMLGQKLPVVRVGILGDKTTRTDGPTNAEVGAAHEFGTSRLPQRSFLRMPLNEKLGPEIDKDLKITDALLAEMIKEGSMDVFMQKIGFIAEGVVLDAFSTNGFGKWQQHALGYTNNTGNILVNTQQLRNSITSEVKDAE